MIFDDLTNDMPTWCYQDYDSERGSLFTVFSYTFDHELSGHTAIANHITGNIYFHKTIGYKIIH